MGPYRKKQERNTKKKKGHIIAKEQNVFSNKAFFQIAGLFWEKK